MKILFCFNHGTAPGIVMGVYDNIAGRMQSPQSLVKFTATNTRACEKYHELMIDLLDSIYAHKSDTWYIYIF